MKRFLKWVGIVLGGLVGLLILSLIVVYSKTQARLTRVYDLPEEMVSIPTDPASIDYGKHIFRFRGCEACHSSGEYLDLAEPGPAATLHLRSPSQDVPHMEGHVYLDDPAIGKVIASNLTSGKGGVGRSYKDEDWIHAIRHGVRPDRTPLLFMPSTEFYFLNDKDLGAVIAYIKSAPAIDHEQPRSSLSLTGRVIMVVLPTFTFIPAELIPHNAPRPESPEPGVTAEYGEYLTQSCKVCHGRTMSGGSIPGFPSSWPPVLNLTFGEGSSLPTWTEEGFMNTIRTGITPDGRELRGKYMPWRSYKYMDDQELKAVWAYLQSLPEKAYGNH
jgi:mono/diheme cytochrome c family protein